MPTNRKTVTKVNDVWVLNETKGIQHQNSDLIRHVFHTAGTFLDSDIEVKINPQVQSGEQSISTINKTTTAPKVTSEVSGSLIEAAGVSTSIPSGGYKTIQATGTGVDGSVSMQPKVTTNIGGWISEGTSTGDPETTTVTTDITNGDTYYIPVVEPTVSLGDVNVSDIQNKITTTISTSTTQTPYSIQATASGTAIVNNASYSNTGGYIEPHTNSEINAEISANISTTSDPVYIKEGQSTVTGGDLELNITNSNDSSQSVSVNIGSGSNVNAEVISQAPANEFYIAVKTETDEKTVATVQATRETVENILSEGYIASTSTTSMVSTSTSQDIKIKGGNSTKYIKITKGSLRAGNPSDRDDEYATISTSTIEYIPSGGNLYLEEGYYNKQKISLAQLVPDEANLLPASSTAILGGYSAYDKNGVLVTGGLMRIDNIGFSGGNVTSTATVTSNGNVGISTEDNGIMITASADAQREAVKYDTPLGYVLEKRDQTAIEASEATTATKNYYISSVTIPLGKAFTVANNGTLIVSTSTTSTVKLGNTTIMENGNISQGELVCTTSAENTTLDVSVSTASVGNGVINAAGGAATTTAPTNGVYIAVNAESDGASIQSTATINKSGWMAQGQYATSDPVDINISGDTTYIPIKQSVVTAEVDSVNITQNAAMSTSTVNIEGATFATSTSTEYNNYITISPSVSATKGGKVTVRGLAKVEESGWISSGTVYSTTSDVTTELQAATDNINYYIPIYDGFID